MSAREDVLASVRANLPCGLHELPEVPFFDGQAREDQVARFTHWLELMGGRLGAAGPPERPFAALDDLLSKA